MLFWFMIKSLMSYKGLKPNPSKAEAVLKMEPPTDKAGVERLGGTVNYLSPFVHVPIY